MNWFEMQSKIRENQLKYPGYVDEYGVVDFKRYNEDRKRMKKSPKANKNRKNNLLVAIGAIIAIVICIAVGCMTSSTSNRTAQQQNVHSAYIQSDVKDYVSEADYAEVYGIYKGWN